MIPKGRIRESQRKDIVTQTRIIESLASKLQPKTTAKEAQEHHRNTHTYETQEHYKYSTKRKLVLRRKERKEKLAGERPKIHPQNHVNQIKTTRTQRSPMRKKL